MTPDVARHLANETDSKEASWLLHSFPAALNFAFSEGSERQSSAVPLHVRTLRGEALHDDGRRLRLT